MLWRLVARARPRRAAVQPHYTAERLDRGRTARRGRRRKIAGAQAEQVALWSPSIERHERERDRERGVAGGFGETGEGSQLYKKNWTGCFHKKKCHV